MSESNEERFKRRRKRVADLSRGKLIWYAEEQRIPTTLFHRFTTAEIRDFIARYTRRRK